MAETILTLALEALFSKGAADAAALAALAVSGEADGTYLLAHETEIPTWRQQAYNTEEAMGGSVNRLTGKVEALEAKPGKRWESIVEKLIWLFVGGVIAAVLTQAGIII